MTSSRAIFSCCCLCASGVAGAAEWSLSPLLSWTVDHESNRRLAPQAEGNEGGFLDVDLLMQRATGTTSFSLRPHAAWQRYTHDIVQDGKNLSLAAAGAWSGDHDVLSTQASVARDDTLNSELADTGLATGTARRDSKVGSISWRHEQGPRAKLEIQLSYSDLKYDNTNYFDFFGLQIPYHTRYGYKYPAAQATESLQLSERSSLQFIGYANKLLADRAGADTDSYGAQLGFTRSLAERLELTVSAGASRQVADQSTTTGYIGRLDVTRKTALGQWSLFASRNVTPSSYGYLLTRNEAGATLTRDITPRAGLWVSARSIWNQGADLEQSGERRQFARAEAGLQWAATRSWHLNTAVSYSRAQFVSGAASASSWRASVGAAWSPQPQRLSR